MRVHIALYTVAFTNHYTEGALYTHIHTHICTFQSFFLQIQGLFHKTLYRGGFTKPLYKGHFAKPLGTSQSSYHYRGALKIPYTTGALQSPYIVGV